MSTYYRYWGKAKKDSDIHGPDYHLLAYHSLDVAAVGYILLDPKKPLCQQLAAQLKVEPEWLQSWFAFCLMLHDLGKFCRAFQNLAPNLSPKLVPYFSQCIYEKRHDSLGYMLWYKVLAVTTVDIIPTELVSSFSGWMEVVCGHHGQPPKMGFPISSYLLPEDEQAAEEFIRGINEFWSVDTQPLKDVDKKDFKKVSWQLAGVAVLADWLGSDQKEFRYRDEVVALEGYWQKTALDAARKVVAQAQIGHRNITPFSSIKQQFNFIENPTPLQHYAQTVSLSDSQQLFILEDVTGAGKTEAAMVLVHRLMALGLANGLYVGLPTMATANAMYQRMGKSYRALYAKGEPPSLVLAHGARNLSDDFTQSVALAKQATDKNYEQADLTASAYCNHWLADSRKKALLADVGVGTIDQALLGILPARHQSLRLLGLTNKVLLVDEVHAFDPYMRSLLIALLQAHAAQGGSVILLSATLPYGFRKELAEAFTKGAGFSPWAIDVHAGYPWVTQVDQAGLREQIVDTRESVKRQVVVKRMSDSAQALEVIRQAIGEGKCVCWIRNTVKDAREAYQQLHDHAKVDRNKLTLFHSRYAMTDRQVIEQDVLQRFGKTSSGAGRSGQILIATQVVEQSLDLDFDVMISDLAPVDLLIQRAGRLQRHVRSANGDVIDKGIGDERESPCLYVLSPDPARVEDQNWLRSLLPGTQAVYPNVGQLWLTIKVLLEKQGFSMPEDARHLIESVYGEDAGGEIPAELEVVSQQAEADCRAKTGIGKFNQLKLEKGYTLMSAGQSNGWDEEVNIPTRLSGDTVTLMLVKPSEGKWAPYSDDSQHGWELSQLSLPKVEWEQASRVIPREIKESIEQLKQDEPALRWVEVLPLVGETSQLYHARAGWLGVVSPAAAGNGVASIHQTD